MWVYESVKEHKDGQSPVSEIRTANHRPDCVFIKELRPTNLLFNFPQLFQKSYIGNAVVCLIVSIEKLEVTSFNGVVSIMFL